MDIGTQKNINIGLPPKVQSSRNSLFEVLLLAVVCGLFFWFVVSPKMSEVGQKKSGLTQYLEQESKVSASLQIFNNLVGKLKTNTAQIAQLDEAVPLEGKPIYLQILLQNLATSAGVTVGNINVSGNSSGVDAGNTDLINNPFKVQRSLQKLSATVFVTGSFSQLETYLKSIETSGRVMQVSSVSITSADSNNLSLNVSLDAYYYAP